MTVVVFIERIVLAIILGFCIGLERQLTGHVTGIRINVLICMGTCFFTLFPILYGSDQVFRTASSIITGVGFLCSGVIFKDSTAVRGINTAATLWCTAAIGILASTDKSTLAIIATIILIFSNLILRPLARRITPIGAKEETEKGYKISIICSDEAERDIRSLLVNTNNYKTLFINNLTSADVVGNKVEIVAEYYSIGKDKTKIIEELVNKVLNHEKVESAGWEIIQ